MDGVNDLSVGANEMLKEFISTFRASLDPRLWLKLIDEEMKELEEVLTRTMSMYSKKEDLRADVLKEMVDLYYVNIGFQLTFAAASQLGLVTELELEEINDFLARSGKVWEKAQNRLGNVDYYEAFCRVHKSNMSKLDENGKPILRSDGKVKKGPNYTPPDLKDLV